MYIGSDAYGVAWEFGGVPGWSMVDRDVGSSKSHNDGPINARGVELIAKHFKLQGLGNVAPATVRFIPPEAFEKMCEVVAEAA